MARRAGNRMGAHWKVRATCEMWGEPSCSPSLRGGLVGGWAHKTVRPTSGGEGQDGGV